MHRLHRVLAFFQINDDGDFYFAGGNHSDIHAFFGKCFEHFRGNARMTAHSHADHGKFSNFFVGQNFFVADFTFQTFDHFFGFEQIGFIDGE